MMSKVYRHTPFIIVLLFLAPVSDGANVPAGISLLTQGIRTAATDETTRGIALYQQGQNEEAIKVLRNAAKRYNNLRAWHYLGLALEKKGDANDARKAHEKAAKLGEALIETQLEGVANSREFRESLDEISVELGEAGRSAEIYVRLNSNLSQSKRADWISRAESLLGFAEMAKGDPATQTVFPARQVDVRARILSKPNPTYTDEARRKMVRGTVVVRAILAANGKVVAIYPIRTLPSGLTAQAIKAARQIKFVPAIKDGKPVSMAVQVEYNFNIY